MAFMCACPMPRVWSSEDNIEWVVPSLHHVGLGDEAQLIRHDKQVPFPSELSCQPVFLLLAFVNIILFSDAQCYMPKMITDSIYLI